MQHDPTSWEVGISGFVCADAIDESASLLNKILATWLDGIEMEDRAAFTRELFDILSAGGATDLSELTKVDNMQRVFAAAAGASDEMKALLGRFAEVGADYARRVAGDAYGKAIAGVQDSAVRGARDLVDVASRKVRSGTSDLVAAWSGFVDSLGRAGRLGVYWPFGGVEVRLQSSWEDRRFRLGVALARHPHLRLRPQRCRSACSLGGGHCRRNIAYKHWIYRL